MISGFFSYLGGLFLGWSVGTNDSANMFGTAVASRMVRFRTAAVLIGVFVVIGAVLQGASSIATVRSLSEQTLKTAVICTFAAAITVTLMTVLKIPVSSSQMMIGAIVGLGFYRGTANPAPLLKVVLCWLLNPLGAMIVSVVLYLIFQRLIERKRPSVFELDPLLRTGLILCGCYGAYALGANGVGVVCAVFVGSEPGMVTSQLGAFLGGMAIATGALTYSRPVMMTIGKGIVPLDAFTAFIAVLALAVTVHLFAFVGVPVSTSQTILGGLLGIGVMKGLHIVNLRMLVRVIIWWIVSPFIAAATAVLGYVIS